MAACPSCAATVDPQRAFPALVALSGILAGPIGHLVSCGGCLAVLRVSISDVVPGMREWPYHPPAEVLSSSSVHRILQRIDAASKNATLSGEVSSIAADDPGRFALRIPEVFRLASAPFLLGSVRLVADAVYLNGLAIDDFVPSPSVGPPASVAYPPVDRVSARFLESLLDNGPGHSDPAIGGFRVLRAGRRFEPVELHRTSIRLRPLPGPVPTLPLADGVLGFAAPLDLLAIDDAPLS